MHMVAHGGDLLLMHCPVFPALFSKECGIDSATEEIVSNKVTFIQFITGAFNLQESFSNDDYVYDSTRVDTKYNSY